MIGPSDDAVRRALAEVLARPEYRMRKIGAPDLSRWLDPLTSWLGGFLGWMHDLMLTAPALFWLIWAAALVLALALLAHVILSLRAALRPRSGPADGQPAPRRRWSSEAESLAQEGKFLAAGRVLQVACLELLASHELLHLGPGHTGAALLRELERSELEPSQQHLLGDLVSELERAVYRDRLEDAGLFSRWRSCYEALVSRWGAP